MCEYCRGGEHPEARSLRPEDTALLDRVVRSIGKAFDDAATAEGGPGQLAGFVCEGRIVIVDEESPIGYSMVPVVLNMSAKEADGSPMLAKVDRALKRAVLTRQMNEALDHLRDARQN